VLRGKQQFHAARLRRLPHPAPPHRPDGPALPRLADQTIFPYTDLLLHDMGPELADGRPDFLEATGDEWRTPPLWGIGLRRDRQRPHRFLHDGRARDPCSRRSCGTAARPSPARDAVLALSADERDDLLAFLRSL
jgi:CxxC motif-containing protein (DUF1111 family)